MTSDGLTIRLGSGRVKGTDRWFGWEARLHGDPGEGASGGVDDGHRAAEGLQSHVAACSVGHRLVSRVLPMSAHVHGATSSAPCDRRSA